MNGVEPQMPPASDFEARSRFWILIALYWIAFAFFPLDRTDLVEVTRLGYGFIALPVLAGACLRTWAAASARAPRHLAEAGTALIMLGFGLTLNRPGFVFFVLALALFMYRLIRRNAEPPIGICWREALLREGYLWIVAAAWLIFAMKPAEPVLYAVLGAALLLRMIAQLFLRAVRSVG